jgi:short subunit dehydrogenase-like uncharacterized protein
MSAESRQYDLVLYGATGYTGKYTAEYLQQYGPTDLKWAIAGRNATKLEGVAKELEGLNKDRKQPGNFQSIEARKHPINSISYRSSQP